MSSPIPRRSVERRSSVVDDGVDCSSLWLLLVLLAVGYYAVTVYQVHSTGRSDQARPVDAIVVMGAAQYDGRPSPQLAARLDHAADLWQLGLAPVMVVTGGNQPGDRFTEAEASANYLIDRGVPADAILQEAAGHSSYASLEGVADLLHERGLFRVLVVSDPFHSLRSRLIAQELGLVAYVSPTRTSPVRGSSSHDEGTAGGRRNRRRPPHRFQAAAVDHRLNDGCVGSGWVVRLCVPRVRPGGEWCNW